MKKLLVNIGERYVKIATTVDDKLSDLFVEDKSSTSLYNNIYIGTVKDYNKRLESVFIDIGLPKKAYLQLDNTNKLPSPGDKVLFQIIKDETDTKGAACSSNINLVGRYIIVILNKSNKNVPKSKVMFSNDLDKDAIFSLKEKVEEMEDLFINNEYNFIFRKESIYATKENIEKETKTLIEKIKSLQNVTLEKNENSRLLYSTDIIDEILTELYDSTMDEVIVDDEETFIELKNRAIDLSMDISKFRYYGMEENNDLRLFELYKIDEEIKKALGKYSWLKHGGELVIEHTEALTVIDVNSAKNEGKKQMEESAFQINCDAALEIARQLRIRNISGIVIVDFINMKDEEHKKEVYRIFNEATKDDKQKVNLVGFTKLCLFELTRQKKRKMLKDIIK